MIRIDTDNAVIRVHTKQIKACLNCYTSVFNRLVSNAEAIRDGLNAITNVRWTVEVAE